LLNRWNQQLKNHPCVIGACLALVGFATYCRVYTNEFIFDDQQQVINNPFVLDLRLWTRIFTGSVWSFQKTPVHESFYRPLQILYYSLVYRMAGPDPGIFHFLQLLLYVATAWLVYWVGCEIFHHETAALVGALLWILHPLHVEAVAWVSGMPDAGCGFFFLLAFFLFVRAEKVKLQSSPSVPLQQRLRANSHAPDERGDMIASLRQNSAKLIPHLLAALAYLAALFFKEMALSFPIVLITYWFFLSPRSSALGWREWESRLLRLAPYLASTVLYLAIRIAALGSFGAPMSLRETWRETLASSVGLLGQHARLFVWPVGLKLFRNFDLGASLRSPWPWIALLVLAATFLFRHKDAALSFLLAWWAVTLLPCLNIHELSGPAPVGDRFSYLPSVGPCLALPLLILCRLPSRTWGRRLVRAAVSALALLSVFWTVLTVRAVRNWSIEGAVARFSLVQLQPARTPADHAARADMLRFQFGDLDGAVREYQMALRLNDEAKVKSVRIEYDSYLGLGNIAQVREHDEDALGYYRRATETSPDRSPAYDYLGAYYFPRKNYDTASQFFSRAVQADPADVSARVYLGTCWMKLGRFKEAAQEFHAARTADPTLQGAYAGEANALEAEGDHAAAARVRASFH
jgi:tetratricopeptide (TPR) repeat protein